MGTVAGRTLSLNFLLMISMTSKAPSLTVVEYTYSHTQYRIMTKIPSIADKQMISHIASITTIRSLVFGGTMPIESH